MHLVSNYFSNESLLDMSRHLALYDVIFGVVRALASAAHLRVLLAHLMGQSPSRAIVKLLEARAKQVTVFPIFYSKILFGGLFLNDCYACLFLLVSSIAEKSRFKRWRKQRRFDAGAKRLVSVGRHSEEAQERNRSCVGRQRSAGSDNACGRRERQRRQCTRVEQHQCGGSERESRSRRQVSRSDGRVAV